MDTVDVVLVGAGPAARMLATRSGSHSKDPVRSTPQPRSPMRLDEVLPRWHFRELHQITMPASSAVVMQALEELTWREVPVFRALMLVRFGPTRVPQHDARVLDWFTDAGFAELERGAGELVFGALQPMSRRPAVMPDARSAEAFRSFDRPGYIKMAINFRCVEDMLRTETRVLGTDQRARRSFRLYWLAIRAGSGMIRHVWLRGIRRRATSGRW